jgi:hypothetical protein
MMPDVSSVSVEILSQSGKRLGGQGDVMRLNQRGECLECPVVAIACVSVDRAGCVPVKTGFVALLNVNAPDVGPVTVRGDDVFGVCSPNPRDLAEGGMTGMYITTN